MGGDEVKLLGEYWPLLFVLGAVVPFLLLLGIAVLGFRIVTYLGPDAKDFFKSGVEANNKTSQAVSEQGPLVKDTNLRVVKIEDVQGVSHLATHEALQKSLMNQRSLARGIIEGMQALETAYPDLHQRFEPAMKALREIENRV